MRNETTTQRTVESRYVQIASRGGILTATFTTPSLGLREAPAISEVVVSAIEDYRGSLRWLVLDASAVTFINSTGLGMCIDARNRAVARGAGAILMGLNDELRTLIELMKIDRLFQVV